MSEKKKETSLYRAKLSCRIGRDALNGKKNIGGVNPMEYALYNVLCVLEDIAAHLEKLEEREEK